MVARVRGMKNGGGGLLILFNAYRVQFGKMAETVEVCGDDWLDSSMNVRSSTELYI